MSSTTHPEPPPAAIPSDASGALQDEQPRPAPELRSWFRTLSARIVLSFCGLFFSAGIVTQWVELHGLPYGWGEGWIEHFKREEFQKLSATADAKKSYIEGWIKERRSDLKVSSRSAQTYDYLDWYARHGKQAAPESLPNQPVYRQLHAWFQTIAETYGNYQDVLLIDAESGTLIASENETRLGSRPLDPELLRRARTPGREETLHVSFDQMPGQQAPAEGQPQSRLLIVRQVQSADGSKLLGLMAFSVDLESEFKSITESILSEILGRSGEVVLYDEQQRFLLTPRYPLPDGKAAQALIDTDQTLLARLSVQGGEGHTLDRDYRNTPVFAAYRHVRISPELGWGMVVKIDESEATEAIRQHTSMYVVIASAGMLLTLFAALLISRWIAHPISKVMNAARQFETGDWSARARVAEDNQVADLAATFNRMAERIGQWHSELDRQVTRQTAHILEQEARLVAYSQATSDAIISIDEHGAISSWNPAAERILGYSADEVIGRDVHQLLVTPGLMAQANAGFRRFSATGEGPYMNKARELPTLTKSGREIIIELTVSPLKVGDKWHAVGTVRDITERKRTEHALRSIAEKLSIKVGDDYFRALAQTIAETIRADYVLIGELDASDPPRVTTVGFMTPQGLSGKNVSYALAGTPCERVMNGEFCVYPANIQQSFPEDLMLAEISSEAYAGVSLTDTSGKAIGLIAALWLQPLPEHSDPTTYLRIFAGRAGAELERTHAQKALARHLENLEETVAERTRALSNTNTELSEALGVLQKAQKDLLESEKLASLGRLVAGIAHELNTPIGNSVTVSTSLTDKVRRFKSSLSGGTIKKSTLNDFTEDVDQGTRLLASSLRQAAELIHDFKQVAVDQTSSQRRSFNLKTVTEEILATLNPHLKKTSHKVLIEIPDDLLLDSFPGPFGQVIANLIQNALTHAFEGRENGSIRLSAKVQDDGGHILLQFCDDGCGMSETVVRQIFEPFFTTKLGQGGSGLGMNIVYNIVTGILGGKIRLQSTPGAGSCFFIELPLRAPDQKLRKK